MAEGDSLSDVSGMLIPQAKGSGEDQRYSCYHGTHSVGMGALAGKRGLSREPQHLHSTVISPFCRWEKLRPGEVRCALLVTEL